MGEYKYGWKGRAEVRPFFIRSETARRRKGGFTLAILSLALAVVAALVDQLIKRLVVVQLKPVGSMTGFITILLIAGLFVYKKHSACSIAASILIIGGGIGNLIDRIFLGYVVDYIHVSFFPPIFNFADCCVTVGTVLLMIHILFFLERKNEKRLDSHE